MQTRGERNNNPMNIERSPSPWVGKLSQSQDERFEQFDTAYDGILAGDKLLLRYVRTYKLDTTTRLISRWAPSKRVINGVEAVENNTKAYIDDVAARIHLGPDDPVNLKDLNLFVAFVSAIIIHEQGRLSYDEAMIARACAEATRYEATLLSAGVA